MSDPIATVLERSSGALTRPSSGVGRGRKGDGVDREKILAQIVDLLAQRG